MKDQSQLTEPELKWLLALLDQMQINGNPEQVRALLHMRDGVYGKLRAELAALRDTEQSLEHKEMA